MATKTAMSSYMAAFDIHYGFENTGMVGRPKAVHNEAAINAMLEFASDHEPEAFVFGGDNLNFGPVSHWEKSKPLRLENQRMGKDLRGFKLNILDPVDEIVGTSGTKKFLLGNHERWILDFAAENPGVSDMLDLDHWLALTPRGWEIIPVGGVTSIGKVYFTHGDIALNKTGSRAHAAKKLVEEYHRSFRCGHVHTYQTYTMHSPLDVEDRHSGVIVPCLCTRAPDYAKNKPNNYMNGFLYGYMFPDGSFHDQVALWINNRYVINGKVYKG